MSLQHRRFFPPFPRGAPKVCTAQIKQQALLSKPFFLILRGLHLNWHFNLKTCALLSRKLCTARAFSENLGGGGGTCPPCPYRRKYYVNFHIFYVNFKFPLRNLNFKMQLQDKIWRLNFKTQFNHFIAMTFPDILIFIYYILIQC